MMNVTYKALYAECRYADYCDAKYRYTECRGAVTNTQYRSRIKGTAHFV
jgi:hypothetical protein